MELSGLEFVAQHVPTGHILGVVDFTRFSLHSKLNDFGTWSGTAQMKTDHPVSVFDLTALWSVRLYALLDGVPVYALDIWYRKRSMTSQSVELSGKMAGSWLDKVTIGGRNLQGLTYSQVEQQTIARDLVAKAQVEWGPAGLDVPVTGVGSRLRDKTTWDAADGKPYGEALRDLVNLQNGFQFTFEPYVVGGMRQYGVRLVTGEPFVTNRAPIALDLGDRGDGQLAGNIRGLEMEESVGAYATDVIVHGAGDGETDLRGYAQNAALGSSIPRLARVEFRTDVETPSWLRDRANTLLSVSGTPALPPVVRLASDDATYPLGSYQVGDRAELNVEPNAHFPDGLSGTWRILEIQFDPQGYGSDVLLTIGNGMD